MFNLTVTDLLLVVVILLPPFGLFFVLFGLITVRRFRKKPDISPHLGASFFGKSPILSVADALTLPVCFLRKTSNEVGIVLNGDYRVLRANAAKLDFILARLTFYTFHISAFLILLAMILDHFGLIE